MLLRNWLPIVVSAVLLSACDHSSKSSLSTSRDELPFQELALSSLDGFRATEATNWQIVGQAYADRTVAKHLETSEGQGVLANLPSEQNQTNLFTVWEHGDMDLSLDFMMPKGSNSGVYLQGRYEVQLLDSWGKDSVSSSDCGAIYERWREDERDATQPQGYEGHSPRINACRAPGLWQHLEIKFVAPRFDEQGKKIANARFEEVILNGSTIQRNVEVTGPTRAAAFDDEQPMGPLMIQGDHGPVAVQNIRYKTYQNNPVKLADLSYQLYEGKYSDPVDLEDAASTKQAEIDSISYQLGLENDPYALVFEGTLSVPSDGEYLMMLRSAGPSWLYLDGKEVTNNNGANYMDRSVGRYQATLEAGTYPMRLVYTKYELKWVRGLSLYVEGPQVKRQALYAESSIAPPDPPEPMVVTVDSTPAMQRAFMYHHGEKKTHTTAVGLPSEINYAVDLANASLLLAWGGDFIDATDMWHERGEPQTARPLGSTLELSDRPTFARLANENDAWPDSTGFEKALLQTKGYTLGTRAMPTFHYQLGQTLIDDYFTEGDAERKLVREISCNYQSANDDPIYCLLAEGDRIEQLPDGSYGVDGKRYYLTLERLGSSQLRQRTRDGKDQLLARLVPQDGKASLRYGIIW